MQYVLIGNCGNHSLAALQFLISQALADIHFVYVDTGWSSYNWLQRVQLTQTFAQTHQVQFHVLKAVADFKTMVKDRKQFPSQKFQWCAGFLKGLALSNFLEDIDPFCQAMIVSGKRRLDSKRYERLKEYQEDDNYFNGRTIWHPLWNTSNDVFEGLVEKSGFDFLNHSSQECHPCIHSSINQLERLGLAEKERLQELEQEISLTMFAKPVQKYSLQMASKNQRPLRQFDFGCGSPWNCGE